MLRIKHFDTFMKCWPSPPRMGMGDEGRSPDVWFRSLGPTKLRIADGTLPQTVSRSSLLLMAANPTVQTTELCVSIFAWGGMNVGHGRRLLGNPAGPWISIADRIRENKVDRVQAYAAFAELRKIKNAMSGLGPAYFTKLIYFLSPSRSAFQLGYIMDQWLGCSINLLTGKRVVNLDHSFKWLYRKGALTYTIDSIVSDANLPEDYESFCRAIEIISDRLGQPWTPELTELALISNGAEKRRPSHPWRTYVINERDKLFEQVKIEDSNI